MKLHTDESDPVLELSEHDLAHPERVVPHVIPGCYLYAPVNEPPPLDRIATTSDTGGDWWREPPPPVKPQKLDRPERLDALRVALASHGLELRHEGAFYSRVEAIQACADRVRR